MIWAWASRGPGNWRKRVAFADTAACLGQVGNIVARGIVLNEQHVCFACIN